MPHTFIPPFAVVRPGERRHVPLPGFGADFEFDTHLAHGAVSSAEHPFAVCQITPPHAPTPPTVPTSPTRMPGSLSSSKRGSTARESPPRRPPAPGPPKARASVHRGLPPRHRLHPLKEYSRVL